MQALFTIDEMPDLFVDACVLHESEVVFLSLWGRDTAVQELLGRLTLQNHERSLSSLTLRSSGQGVGIGLKNPDAYRKKAARIQSKVFGQLSHLWLYHSKSVKPDKATREAYVLQDGDHGQDAVWSTVMDLCPYPVLASWQRPVMAILNSHELIQPLQSITGHVRGWYLDLKSEVIAERLSDLIQSGQLTAK